MNNQNTSYRFVVAGTCLIVAGIAIALWPLVASPLAMSRLAIKERKIQRNASRRS